MPVLLLNVLIVLRGLVVIGQLQPAEQLEHVLPLTIHPCLIPKDVEVDQVHELGVEIPVVLLEEAIVEVEAEHQPVVGVVGKRLPVVHLALVDLLALKE